MQADGLLSKDSNKKDIMLRRLPAGVYKYLQVIIKKGFTMEKLLKLLSDTESISPNDELSKLIASELNDELTEDMLEFVSAASGSDYDKFRRYLENSDKNK